MTVTLRDAVAPEEPVAVMVMVLNPVRSGIDAVQLDVPEPTPDCPKLFDHAMDAAPAAVPAKVIDAALVETAVEAGEVMASVTDPVGWVGEGVVWRVTVTDCETRVDRLSVAVTVIVLAPLFRGI